MKTFTDGEPVFGAMLTALIAHWLNGTVVTNGCAPSGSAVALSVTIGAGTVFINGTSVSVAGSTETLTAAGASDRYDLVTINTSGEVVVTTGSEEKKVPAIPANSCVIAIVQVDTGQTTLPATKVFDARVLAASLIVRNFSMDGTGTFRSAKSSCQPASTPTLYEFTGTLTTLETSYTKVGEIAVPAEFVDGSRFRLILTVKGDGSHMGYGRVYKDGVAYGDEHSTTDGTGIAYTDDLTFAGGDLIQIYVHGTGGDIGGCAAAIVCGTVCGGIVKGADSPSWS